MTELEEPPKEIWSTILSTVATSKATPTKNILLLGEPNSGKSNLIHYFNNENILKDKQDADNNEDYNNLDQANQSLNNNLGLNYEFVDLKDELEDTIGRLNFVELSDTNPNFHQLLNLSLNLNNFTSTLACIFLDWSEPWNFIQTLQKWLTCLEVAIFNIQQSGGDSRSEGTQDRWTLGKQLLDEAKEKLQRQIQEFKEPTSAEKKLNALKSDSNTDHSVLLPLGNGCLTMNLGIPIIVICSKSDQMKVIEREGNYKEEEFDFIQQTLRTTCLQYGASLIYTSNQSKSSLNLIKNYILTKSFPTTNNISILPNYLSSYKFKAQVVDREKVFVPAGWDSWNKIRVLRDSFNCEGVLQGMEFDLSHERSKFLSYVEPEQNDDTDEMMSINEYYCSIVKIPYSKDQRTQSQDPPIEAYSEQDFLQEQFNILVNTSDSASTKVNGNLNYVGTLGKVHSPSLNQTLGDNSLNSSNHLGTSTPSQAASTPAELVTGAPLAPENAEKLSNFFGDFLKKGKH